MVTLVLLPGLDGTGELFRPLLEALGPSVPAVSVTYPATSTLSYGELESMVLSLLPSNPFVLLGESFSGPIAISIAARNPEHLKGVVLSCSFASCPRPAAALALPLLRLPLPLPPVRVLGALLAGRFATLQLLAMLGRALKNVAVPVLRHRLAEVARIDVREKLARIEVPVLYLQASEDRIVPAGCAATIREVLPAMEIRVIRGPHFLLQAGPVECASAIRDFLARVACGR